MRRASVMSVREYVSRLTRLLRDIAIYPLLKCFGAPKPAILKAIDDVKKNSVFSDVFGMDMERDFPDVYRTQCVAEADLSSRHRFSFFDLKEHCLGTVIQWNYDYKNNVQTPLRYAPLLNFRSFKTVGDIKYVFEHNKHQDLPRLAQAYYLTGDYRYLDELVCRVDSWIDQCPFMFGVHWTSPSVSAYRLVSWTLVFEILLKRSKFAATFLEKWAQSVYQHIQFISKNYSRFSSAGNHLISEAVGVFVASLRWKVLFGGRERIFLDIAGKQAYSILLAEMESQVFPDGVNHEQSASYQVFASNQMFIAYWIGTMSGISFPVAFTDRLRKSGEFLAAILDVRGMSPNFGDEDSAWAFRLAAEASNKFVDQLGVWSVLFNDPSLARSDKLTETAYWLFGARAVEMDRSIENKHAPTGGQCVFEEKYFPIGGYYCATFDRRTSSEAFFFLDCGPLGMRFTGGHGHADALSMCLTLGGEGVFIDSGTYVYKNTLERQMLRSTSAHNTLYFSDMASQDKYFGPFLWGARHQAAGRMVAPGCFVADVTWWSGETHCRETVIKPNILTITDRWHGTCPPSIAFHLNPQLQEFVRQEQKDCISIETDAFCCRLHARDQCVQLEKTIVSPAFYQLRETFKVVIPSTLAEGTQVTEITWEFK